MTPRQFSLRHGQVAALTSGTSQKGTVLCLHGWLDNAASFTPFADVFPASEWQLVCPDWPGHGYSDHRPGYYPFADWVDDLWQLTEQITGPIVLLGHSLGALVASCFVAAFPERVSGLIMIEGVGPLTEPVANTTIQLRKAILNRAELKQTASRKSPIALVRAKARALELPEQYAKLLVERGAHKHEGNWQWRHDPALLSQSPFRLSESQARVLIHDIRCPVTVILGTEGYSWLKSALERRRSCFRQLQIHTFQGNHHVHLTNCHQVATAVREFLITL